MAGENDIVEDIERVELPGSGGPGAGGAAPEGDAPEGDEPAGEGEPAPEGEGQPDKLVHTDPPAPEGGAAPAAPATGAAPQPGAAGEPKKLPGESDREYALRLEVTRLKGERRRDRAAEITGEVLPAGAARKELSEEQKQVIGKYKPEELAALREVFPVLAQEMGFVRSEELTQTEYAREADTQLNSFLEKHPEYLPENDPGNVLWDRFKETYGMFRPPASARDLGKILEKVHRDVFGIQAPGGVLPKTAAAQRKVEVASHAGAPASPSAPRTSVHRTATPQGIRTDMLKGFKPEEIEEMTGGGE